MISDNDVRMVVERLGLSAADVDDCRAALEDLAWLGQDGFEDQTLLEAATAVEAAYSGQRPTEAVVRRAVVRKTMAVALRQMTELRDALAQYDGPKH